MRGEKMTKPGEHKTVQSRILAYAQEIGWTYVPRAEAERRRDFDPAAATLAERARKASLFFGDLLHAQVRAFNVHELLHFSVPNHGKLWKSLMHAHIGEYEHLEARMKQAASNTGKVH